MHRHQQTEAPRAPRTPRIELAICLALAAALVGLRSYVFVAFEQAQFDSDQAVVGLMAKQLGEGRAFPLFHYGLDYLLMVEAWLIAPVFRVLEPSVAALKAPLAALNVAIAWLLIWQLSAHLRPTLALLACMPLVLPPPIPAAELVQALGGNVVPFLFVIGLWLTRRRPIWFGAIFGLGFLVRPFVLYGLAGVLLLELLDGTLLSRRSLYDKLASLLACVAVWQLVDVLALQADPLGPGSSGRELVGVSSNVGVLGAAFCWDPAVAAENAGGLITKYLPVMLGGQPATLADTSIRSALAQGESRLWPLIGAGLLGILLRGIWVTRGSSSPRPALPRFGLFLMAVGATALLVYAISRCGPLSLLTMRYALLGLLGPVGLLATYLAVEPASSWRRGVAAGIVLWAALNGIDHLRLIREYALSPPAANHRALADHLLAHGVRYAMADYWTAYHVTFLAQEQVVVAPYDLFRVEEYQRALAARRASAVLIGTSPCPDGAPVRGWFVCPPDVPR